MAVTINSGLVDTADPLSDELKVDMRETIAMLDPDVSQFSTMLMKLPSERAKSFKVEWMNDQLLPRVSGLAASATSAATTLSVTADEGNYFKAGDIVRIPQTGEAVRVTAASASSITVVRGQGSVTAATAASAGAGSLIIVGGSNAQGATLPTALITQRTANYNYTNIIRDAARFTETALATDWYGGDLLQDKEIGKKATEHKANIENTLFFGARSYSASNPPRHTAGGLVEYISTNVTDASGEFDKSELQNFLRTGLQHGSNRKVLFCAPIVAQVISEFLQDNWVRAQPNTKLWGAKVNAVISAVYGTDIPVVVKRQWGAYGTPAAGRYSSIAFLVDMENVQFAPLRPTKLARDRQARDADERAVEYISEFSLKVEREETHAMLEGVTT